MPQTQEEFRKYTKKSRRCALNDVILHGFGYLNRERAVAAPAQATGAAAPE
jgi:hypothetical protein